MKKIKRLVSFVLAILMIQVLAAPALAADDYVPGQKPADQVPADKKTAQIYIAEPLGESNTGHTYYVYQLFVGESSTDENGEPALMSLTKGFSGPTGALFPEDVLDILNNPDMTLEQKNTQVYKNVSKNNVYATMENSNVGAFLDVEPGYYLLIDKTEGVTVSYPIYGMAVDKTEEGRLNYEPKAKLPTFKKEVRDNNAHDDEWGKEADFSYTTPGASALTPNLDGFDNPNVTLNAPHADAVAFRLTATLGDNYDMYKSYQLIFHDTLPIQDGPLFSLIADTKGNVLYRVEIVGADGESKFDTFSLNADNGIQQEKDLFQIPEANEYNKIEFRIDNIKTAFKKDGKLVELAANDEIRITYYAYTDNKNFPLGDAETLDKLKEEAEYPWMYEPATNDAYLEYSNNPYSDQKGETPHDHATVYSYGLIALKTNKDSEPVSSAGFALYKKDTAGNWVNLSGIKYHEDEAGQGFIDGFGYESYGNCYDMHEFTNATIWNQLDSGEYKLVEVEAPDGYEKLDKPILFSLKRDEKTGKVTIFQSLTDENDMVTFNKNTEKAYRFYYYRPTGEVDEDGYPEFEDPIDVYINESSPLYRGDEGHVFYFADEMVKPTDISARLADLVIANDDESVLLDNNGGAWTLPFEGDGEVNEYQLFCITVRNGYIPPEPILLPSTGGIGTTVFYVVGSMMVLCAGVLLVTKKRTKQY